MGFYENVDFLLEGKLVRIDKDSYPAENNIYGCWLSIDDKKIYFDGLGISILFDLYSHDTKNNCKHFLHHGILIVNWGNPSVHVGGLMKISKDAEIIWNLEFDEVGTRYYLFKTKPNRICNLARESKRVKAPEGKSDWEGKGCHFREVVKGKVVEIDIEKGEVVRKIDFETGEEFNDYCVKNLEIDAVGRRPDFHDHPTGPFGTHDYYDA